jgi:hypothetical protein
MKSLTCINGKIKLVIETSAKIIPQGRYLPILNRYLFSKVKRRENVKNALIRGETLFIDPFMQ